ISQLHQRDDVGWAEIAELFNEARRRAGATSSVRHQILCRLFHLETERRSGTRSGSPTTPTGAVDDRNWLNAEDGAPVSEDFGRSREKVRQHRVRDGPPVTPSNATQTGADDIRALMERDRRLRNLKKRE